MPCKHEARTGPKRWLLLAALLGAALGVNTAVAALQFDVFLGYDGIVREASWAPVVCEIKNDGPPINGVIEVSPGSYGKGQTHLVPVELPTGTLKRVVIPVFSGGRGFAIWNVRLLDERGKTRAEQTAQRPRRQLGWEIPLIGSLARTAAGAPVLRPIARDQADTQPASARMQPSIFPDNPLALEGLDALYLSSEVASELRSSQVNAILAWMNAGGNLIVAVEQISDITASPWLRAAMPCEPKEMKTFGTHPELQTWLTSGGWRTNAPSSTQRNRPSSTGVSAERPFADLTPDSKFEIADLQVAVGPLRDGQVVVATGGAPLIVTANRGRGKVTALLFSPEREPFRSWKHLPTFWAKLAEVPGQLYVSSDYNAGFGQSADGIFGAMIDSRQIHKLPIGWLLLLLLVYLVIIGPFDQWWLKRIGKPMLTWITFPCYVVMFSLLIYFIGYKLRAGESEYNEFLLVDVLRNGERAELRGRTYASIYSPSNLKFPLEGRQKIATLRGEFLGSGAEGTERAEVLQNGDSFKADVFVPVWTSQLYVSDWWQSASLPLNVAITPQNNGWSVSVKNATDHPVKSAQLVMDGRVVSLGEVGAGNTRVIAVTREQGTPLRDYVQQYGQQFYHVVQQRQYAFGASGGGRLNDLPNCTTAASFLAQLRQDQNYYNFAMPPGLDLSRTIERGNAVLLAWMPDYSPVQSMNQFKPRRNAKNTMLRIPVPLNAQSAAP